ncbi:hypothetical protein DPMN_052595 [Dreissena polymorpha]|uniref:Uncharacterized protein n=1 Tax=Dreissena polymorpha TaxID=45954 RepID=A0A9D4CM80_DREPO|nr:hypothetical protein DPMN_052595 [Dreissena polymorpha]
MECIRNIIGFCSQSETHGFLLREEKSAPENHLRTKSDATLDTILMTLNTIE